MSHPKQKPLPKWTRKMDSAIVALLERPTHEEAARSVRISLSTLKRWLARPDFQARYRAAGRELADGAMVRLLQIGGSAVLTLYRNLTSKEPAVQVRAALGILDHIGRLREREDAEAMESRLEAMEAALKSLGAGTPRPEPVESPGQRVA